MSTMHSETVTPPHSAVIIVGMGPTGMVAALSLAQRGVEVTVLEAGSTLSAEDRASTFHPSSLEILHALGVGEKLHTLGLVAPHFQYRDRSGGVLADLDLNVLSDDTAFPYRLQSEQSNLTGIIRERLSDLPNVRLLFSSPVERTELATDGVRVFLEGAGREPSLTADWLIAADGARSRVRKSLGIAFEGTTLPERFLVASTTHEFADDIDDLAYVSYISDPVDWGVLLRTPRHWRVLMPVRAEMTDDDACAPEEVERRLQKVWPTDEPYPLDHVGIYTVQQRVAATMATGRVLLAGDAAHVNNPLGGMGMNSGIHDARAAADCIVAAIDGADAALVARAYDDARRHAANHHVQKDTKRNYRDMSERDAEARHRRTADLASMTDDRELTRAYLMKTSMLASLTTSEERLKAGLRAARRGPVQPAGRRLAALLTAGPVVAPGAHDALSARMLGEAGFAAGFISGAGVSATVLGEADLGHVGRLDMVEQISRLTDSCTTAFIADGDGGFGGPLQVSRTVRAYESAGAAAITLEDQREPKGGSAGGTREVIPLDEMSAKIRAAVDARCDLLIIARSDALGAENFAGVLRRAEAYAAAGADLLFVEGRLDAQQLQTLHRRTGLKLVVNLTQSEGEELRSMDLEELRRAGVGIILHPVAALLAAARAARSTYRAIAETQLPDPQLLLTWRELTDLVGLPLSVEAGRRYAVTA
ncbi:NAD(P)-binding protein [Microbacterium hatanonis]|uniref:NAD(P)-binding protein n=2 Tax=Microbacterium hatanonis TaxID=404366 RepID=A0A5C8I362_9MICO|nr:NAD(P)-binding protein [Microbacterium hatanonis]